MSNGESQKKKKIKKRKKLCDNTRGSSTHLSRWTAAGEEVASVVAMQRDVEDAWVAVEDFLGAVAMVDVLTAGCERGNNIEYVCIHLQ